MLNKIQFEGVFEKTGEMLLSFLDSTCKPLLEIINSASYENVYLVLH